MRRYFGMVLAFLAVLAMTVAATATTLPQRVQSLHPQFSQTLTLMELDGASISPDQLADLEVRAGSELRIYLCGEGESLFFDQNDAPIPTPDVTLSRLRAGRVSLERLAGNGSQLVEKLEFAYSNRNEFLSGAAPYIRIQFVRDFVSVEEVPFAFRIALRVAGETQEQTELEIAGTMRTTEIAVWENGTTVDLRDGGVVVAESSARDVELRLCEELVVYANLRQGERYYGAAYVDTGSYEMGDQTGDVLRYNLQAIGLDKAAYRVSVNSGALLYVYDGAGNYLGTTSEKLPYSNTYYLIDKRMQYYRP